MDLWLLSAWFTTHPSLVSIFLTVWHAHTHTFIHTHTHSLSLSFSLTYASFPSLSLSLSPLFNKLPLFLVPSFYLSPILYPLSFFRFISFVSFFPFHFCPYFISKLICVCCKKHTYFPLKHETFVNFTLNKYSYGKKCYFYVGTCAPIANYQKRWTGRGSALFWFGVLYSFVIE